MSKFNTTAARPVGTGPIVSEQTPSGATHEGGPGYVRSSKSELFLLAVANMVGEDTFYQRAHQRDDRYTTLVRQVAVADGAWMHGFVGWLRGDANMRSASLVAAAEAVRARLDAGKAGTEVANGARNRQIIDAALQRADEPGELLAYWTSRYGRAIPKPVKRGVADAIGRLYTERALLKYDTASHGFRFADVIDLVHPSPAAPWQGDLFMVALERRHNRDTETPLSLLTLVRNGQLRHAAAEDPAVLLDADRLREAGMTWEDALSLAGPSIDKARLWEAMIPSMGLMGLSRNLRNFDQAGVSDDVAATVAARFADPEQVARSRMFPFRWLAAYRNAPSLRWAHPLDKALTASLANVPALPGRTLILVDRSPSMFPGYWFSTANRSDITLADQAALFGCALALRAADPTLVVYGGTSRQERVPKGGSVLRMVEGLGEAIDSTDTAAAVRAHFAGHDRVVIVTDEQTRPGYAGDPSQQVPSTTPLYTWNLAGYQHGHGPSGAGNRHTFGGLTDAAFRMVPLIEAGRNAAFPWQ